MSCVPPHEEPPDQSDGDTLAERAATSSQEETGVVLQQERSLFVGPLPHPELFQQYGNVLPDAPKRILDMAEREQRSIHKDRRSSRLENLFAIFGAILVSLALVGGGIAVTWLGYPWGSIPFATALIVGAFLGDRLRPRN